MIRSAHAHRPLWHLLPEVARDDLFERQVAALRDTHQARQERRHLDAGELAAARDRVAQQDREVDGQARDVREGVRRVHRERGEDGVDALGKHRAHVVLLRRSELRPTQDLDALLLQRGADVVLEDAGLLIDEIGDALQDSPVEFLREDAARTGLRDAGVDASLESGDAHHEELIEVARENGEEFCAFDQRDSQRILRLVQHALVELEPRQLAVVEAILGQIGGDCVGHAPLPKLVSRFATVNPAAS